MARPVLLDTAMRTRLLLSVLLLAAHPGCDDPDSSAPQGRAAIAADDIPAARAVADQLGLSDGYELVGRGVELGEGDIAHERVEVFYRGIPVRGGELITHVAEDGELLAPTTEPLPPEIDVSLEPSVGQVTAEATVLDRLEMAGTPGRVRSSELALHPRDDDFAGGFELVWEVSASCAAPDGGPCKRQYLLDAESGEVLDDFSAISHATPAVGTGQSLHSGNVMLNTSLEDGVFWLHDLVSGGGVRTRTNLTDPPSYDDAVYVDIADEDNFWGTTLDTVLFVDIHYGAQAASQLLQQVFGRNGYDGKGSALDVRVHKSKKFVEEASWDRSDKYVTVAYKYSTAVSWLTQVFIIGHEVGHAVLGSSINGHLSSNGESGGINEGVADIFGLLSDAHARYMRQGTGNGQQQMPNPNFIPDSSPWQFPVLFDTRYMCKPSKDGESIDEVLWDVDLSTIDGHSTSGVVRRMFCLLSRGVPKLGTLKDPEQQTTNLPGGLAMLGLDKAARIFYTTVNHYMTSQTNTFAKMRAAMEQAATHMYGSQSPEHRAVMDAWAAVGVGDPADRKPPNITLGTSGNRGTILLQALVTDDDVELVHLYVDGNLLVTDTVFPFQTELVTDTRDASGNLVFPNGTHTFSAKAYDTAMNVKSAAIDFVVDNTAPVISNVLIQNGPCDSHCTPESNTKYYEATVTDNIGMDRVEMYAGGILVRTEHAAPWEFLYDWSSEPSGPHHYSFHAYDDAGNVAVWDADQWVDTTPPVVVLPGPTGSTGAFEFQSLASDDTEVFSVKYGIKIPSGSYITVGYAYAPPWSVVFDSAASPLTPNGTHELVTYARDVYGNSSEPVYTEFAVYNEGPPPDDVPASETDAYNNDCASGQAIADNVGWVFGWFSYAADHDAYRFVLGPNETLAGALSYNPPLCTKLYAYSLTSNGWHYEASSFDFVETTNTTGTPRDVCLQIQKSCTTLGTYALEIERY